MMDLGTFIIAIILFAPVSVGLWLIVWYLYRIWRPMISVDDVLTAYEIVKLKHEIEKRDFNFEQMMLEYYKTVEVLNLSKKTKKGMLDRIDDNIVGELEEINSDKPPKKKGS